MSGGVDSALTAALFKSAGWRVIGITMPIHQVPEETQRGIAACEALGIERRHLDLSALADFTVETVAGVDEDMLVKYDDPHSRLRRGNVRARLRMITLYSVANALGGIVASTDNLSELGAGFWTICGDVGDVSPVQALTKSWEIPYLAKCSGVPESIWRATPTDGNAVMAGGDEAQLGASYLEWDIMAFALSDAVQMGAKSLEDASTMLQIVPGSREASVFDAVVSRMGRTWFKRVGPINFPHPLEDRYQVLSSIDETFFIPAAAAA
jgi:nicotinamide-nucleotide amidase